MTTNYKGRTRRRFLRSLGASGAALERDIYAAVRDAVGPGPRARVVADMRMIALGPENLHPAMVKLTPEQDKALVPCQDTNTLAVLNRLEYTLERTVRLDKAGDVPWDVCTSTDGSRAFVTNSAWNEDTYTFKTSPSTVSVVDLDAGEEVDAVEVGVFPNGIELHAGTGRAFVANTGDDTVTVIDTNSLECVETIPVKGGPYSVASTPEGTYVAVVSFESATVTVIDPKDLRPVHEIQVGQTGLTEPHPEHGPGDSLNIDVIDERRAYVTNFRSTSVALIDLEAGEVLHMIPLPRSAPVVVCGLTPYYGLIAGYGIFGIMDFRDRTFLQRFIPRAPVYAKEFVSTVRTPQKEGGVEKIITIATALAAIQTRQADFSGERWAPLRTKELWTTDANTHSVGVIPIRNVVNDVDEDDLGVVMLDREAYKPRLLDLDELATVLGLPREGIEWLHRESALPGFGFGTDWFVSLNELRKWLSESVPASEADLLKQALGEGE